jgi:ribosomal protein L44E
MLGTCRRPWCPYCRRPAEIDCPDVSRDKKSERAREKRAWRREAAQT